MALRTCVWNRLTSSELAAAQRLGAVVLVPFGATEQHGRHLAADTDILIATEVCVRAAARADCPVLVANVSDIGFSPEHMALPGAISLRLETFIAVVTDIVKSICRHGFRRIMLVNGHGGNMRPLRAAAMQLAADGYPAAVCTYWVVMAPDQSDILKGPVKQVGHACEFETSIVLYLRPDGAAMDLAIDSLAPPWNPDLKADPLAAAGIFFPSVVRPTSPGIVGAPSFAKEETGRALVEVAVAKLASIISELHTLDLE